jgi:hypothetical protein
LHVLHADIQGAELDMLTGAAAALSAKRIDYIFISTHDECHVPSIERLRSHDYRILAEHSIAESSSADGLIVAVSPTLDLTAEVLRAECAATTKSGQ